MLLVYAPRRTGHTRAAASAGGYPGETTGLENSFYVIGALAVGLLTVIGCHAWRHDGFRTPGDS